MAPIPPSWIELCGVERSGRGGLQKGIWLRQNCSSPTVLGWDQRTRERRKLCIQRSSDAKKNQDNVFVPLCETPDALSGEVHHLVQLEEKERTTARCHRERINAVHFASPPRHATWLESPRKSGQKRFISLRKVPNGSPLRKVRAATEPLNPEGAQLSRNHGRALRSSNRKSWPPTACKRKAPALGRVSV